MFQSSTMYRQGLVAGISLILLTSACSGSDLISGTATGGTEGLGGNQSTGGGGISASGGAPISGGSATGGVKATGGASSSGGAATGGVNATGGAPNSGGSATGGTNATGGTPSSGGAATGGKAMGGASNSGGAATGGSATGGKAAGGVPAGGMATGGAVAGGTKATGGAATGGAATGGAAAGGTSSGVTDWLHTQGNQIQHQDGTRFHGRGADIFDTRQCGGCKWAQPDVPEVIRRVDTLVDVWHANFMRFDLSAFTQSTDPQWGDVTQDPVYLAGLVEIMTHIGTKPGVYVMITMFGHPSMDANELPTAATMPVYQKLSDTFKDMPQVLYGITNEPHGATDAAVWTAMNNAVTAIRSMEPAAGPHHLIAAQGTQNYARQTNYYITHPITAGGGVNIIYETHPYNPPADWTSLVVTPAQSLPLIIGEFGPVTGTMTVTDCGNLMVLAEQNEVPYAVWSFSPQCGPTLLVTEPSTVDCAGGFPLTASDWGNALIQQLAKPY